MLLKALFPQLMHLILHFEVSEVLGALSQDRIFPLLLLLMDLLTKHILMVAVERSHLLRVILLTDMILLVILLQCD